MKAKNLIYCSLFAAINAVFAQISIPLPFTEIPISLGVMAVMLTGALLGAKYGSLSLLIYILIGAVGSPVFSKFGGGLAHLAGPTGGYILGYLPCVFIIGLLSDKYCTKSWNYMIAMVIGYSFCLAFGTGWFIYSTKNNLIISLSKCVIPFLPFDAVKIIASGFIVTKLKKIV